MHGDDNEDDEEKEEDDGDGDDNADNDELRRRRKKRWGRSCFNDASDAGDHNSFVILKIGYVNK